MAFATVIFLGLLVFPLTAISQSYQNVSLGSSLTTSDVTTFWPSPSGEFAFGFQKIGNGGFILAIWFNKHTEKTIVWSANRNSIAPKGSYFHLSTDGRLVLFDPNGQEIWAGGTAGVAYGAMLDTGNFVLATSSSAILWQSFDEPTDTILPGQVLDQGNKLVSSFSDTNVSSGKFELILQTDRNLVLYTVNYPLDAPNDAYWATNSVGSGYQVIFNQSRFIFLLAQNGTLLNSISSNEANSTTSQLYHRAIPEYDGVFRHYVSPKSSSGRPMAWSTLHNIPDNICARWHRVGGGACGFNNICSMGTNGRPRCDCPLGYILNDPNDKLGGCRRNFSEQDCNHEWREIEAFNFQEILNFNWFGSDYASYQDVSEDWCKQNCLSDCFCAAAIYDQNVCWKKKYPLSNGILDPSEDGKALIKIRKDNSTVGSPPTTTTPHFQTKRKSQSTLIISGSVLLGSSLFILMLLAVFI